MRVRKGDIVRNKKTRRIGMVKKTRVWGYVPPLMCVIFRDRPFTCFVEKSQYVLHTRREDITQPWCYL